MLLSVNDDVTLPGTIVCVDVQTIDVPDQVFPNRFRKVLRCWSAVSGRIEGDKWTREQTRDGCCGSAFWDFTNFVRIIHRPVWVFISDLTTGLTTLGLWTLLESGEFRLNRQLKPQTVKHRQRYGKRDPKRQEQGLLVSSPGASIVVFYHKTGWKVIALDSTNYFGTTAVQDAHDTGTTYESVTDPNAPLANWLYCSALRACSLRDRITDLAVWHRQQEFGRFGYTVSGTALAAFRHRFMHTQPNLPEDQDERDYEREAFYQGRTEPFWIGKVESGHYTPLVVSAKNDNLFEQPPPRPFHLVDSRSMYGAVGVFCELPWACIGECQTAGNAPDLGNEEGRDLLATVTIDSPHGEFPLRRDGRTIFARGQFTTTLAGPELHRAIKDETITRWHRWRRYAMCLLFRPYSLALWEERLKQETMGNIPLERVCKALLARLHGKFLQRVSRWENRPELFASEPWDEWWETSTGTARASHYRSIGHDVQEEVDAGDAPHCFPAIAAWVTAYGREWLRSWMGIAGERNVLYCATDSLIVTEEGRVNLENAGIVGDYGIGSMRVVQTSDSLVVRGVGGYQIGTKIAHQGIPDNSVIDVEGHYKSVQLDSLESILFVRRGTCVQGETRSGHCQSVPLFKLAKAGGWLETPCLKIPRHDLAPVP